MNIERMLLLKAHTLSHPANYEQNTWGGTFEYVEDQLGSMYSTNASFLRDSRIVLDNITLDPKAEVNVCGTACCFAGSCVFLESPSAFAAEIAESGALNGGASGRAQIWLDLTDRQAAVLFSSAGDWPPYFAKQYANAETLQERAQVGANMIDYMIENQNNYLVDDEDEDDDADDCCFDDDDDEDAGGF